MKLFTLFALLCLVPTLYGCPKKKTDGVGEQVEGSSSADKSGESSTDEMQEKKGGNDAAPAGDAAGEKKD